MIRFSVNGKELKEMINKVLTVVPKKSSVPALSAVYFKVDENGNFSVFGTDYDQWLEISAGSCAAFDTESGILGIDIDDVKIITGMSGIVQCMGVLEGDHFKLRVSAGKKVVNIPALVWEENSPEVKMNPVYMQTTESWLYDTLTKLYNFLAQNDLNHMMQAYNFNLKAGRVEALDGHRIGIRNIPESMINDETASHVIYGNTNDVMKKVLDKKSESPVYMSAAGKFNLIKGENFRYLNRYPDGTYFKIENMLVKYEDSNIAFTVNAEEMAEVMKYDYTLTKDVRLPLVIANVDGELYCYIKNSRLEVLDRIDSDIKTPGEFMFGVNPKFMLDALNVVDSDNPLIYGIDPKSPWVVSGNDYHLLVLPVNMDRDSAEIAIHRCINESGKKEA